MAPALTLIFLGNAYNFFGNASPISASNQTPITNQPGTVLQVAPIGREDYNYTPGVGAHKVHNQATEWSKAQLICRKEGGDLAIINSKAEAEILVQLLAASGPHVGSNYTDYTYIGFHDLFKEGRYETVDGQSLSDAGYNEWGPGEPNSEKDENCGSMNKGKLHDVVCDASLGFICELPNPVQGMDC